LIIYLDITESAELFL